MEKKILLFLKNKKNYYDYFKQNSFFIKDFNRGGDIKIFEEFIKNKYHLKVTDKVNNVIENLDLINVVLDSLKN